MADLRSLPWLHLLLAPRGAFTILPAALALPLPVSVAVLPVVTSSFLLTALFLFALTMISVPAMAMLPSLMPPCLFLAPVPLLILLPR